MSNNTLDTGTLAQLHGNYLAGQKQNVPQQPQQKKGNLLTNMLPAIGGGLGAVAGIPLDFLGGAGSIAGGAAGASLGEALKEHLLGQNLSAKQIGIQGLEGGALSAFNPLKALGAASGAAKGFVNSGKAVAQIADKTAMEGVDRSANSLADKLVTQGQQAQGRVAGTSAGKAGQVIITPQDTARYNAVLSRENIPVGNANTTLQAVQSRLNQYGKQIGDHFSANNSPLNPADTKTLAANYLTGLKTTDPGVLKQASVLANDLEKNVTDTKSLWEFRKALDTRIPDSKLAASNNVLSDKMTAIKGLRQHISDQLGDIPGASQYHDLSEVKPLVAGEAQRLNNPGGGLLGRLVASGPAQKTEALVGKATEAAGTKLGGKSSASLEDALKQASTQSEQSSFAQVAASVPKQGLDQVLASRGIPVKYESSTYKGLPVAQEANKLFVNSPNSDIQQALDELKGNGYSVDTSRSTIGSRQSIGKGRGIPITSIESTASGTGVPININKVFTGKTPTEVADTIQKLKDAGFAVDMKTGNITSLKSFNGGGNSVFERGNTTPVTSVNAHKTNIPITGGQETSSTLASQPRVFTPGPTQNVTRLTGNRTALPLQQSAIERGVINTPNTYRTEIPSDVLQQASDAAGRVGSESVGSLPTTSLAAKALATLKGTATLPARAALAPLAYPGRSIGQVGKQVIGHGVGSLLTGGSSPSGQGVQPTDLAGALSQTAQPDQSQQVSQSPYSQEALQHDVERDPANAEKYIQYFTNLDKIYNPPTKALNSTQQQSATNAQSGLDSLSEIAQELGKNPNAAKVSALDNIPGLGSVLSNATGTGSYSTAIKNASDVIGRLRSGGAINSDEEKTFRGFLPAFGDSQDTINYKLQSLAKLFRGFVNPGSTTN